MNLIALNPELQRNLWVELTPPRLVVTPLLVGAFLYWCWLLDGQLMGEALGRLPLYGFLFSTCGWGAKLAADSLWQEVSSRTWENQRLSALSPWTLTWGKLLGGTAVSWYLGIPLLLVYGLNTGFRLEQESLSLFSRLLLLVMAALFSQGMAMLVTLQTMRRFRLADNRALPRGIFVISIGLFMITLVTPLTIVGPEKMIWQSIALMVHLGLVKWHGWSFDSYNFIMTTAILFLGWCLIGVTRMMGEELQERRGPWVWLGFLLFLMVYVSGFVAMEDLEPIEYRSSIWQTAILLAVAATYVMLFTEAHDPLLFSRMGQAWKDRQWREFSIQWPCWLVSLLLAALMATVYGGLVVNGTLSRATLFNHALPALGMFSILLFLTRDIGVLLLLQRGPFPRRASSAALVYFLLLYWFAPMLLEAMGLSSWTLFIFWNAKADPVLALLVAGAEAVMVFLFLVFDERSGKRLVVR